MVQIKTWVSVGLLGVIATACGGSEDLFSGDPAETSGPTIAEIPLAFTSIFCDAFEECVGPTAKLQFQGQSCEDEFGKTIADGDLSLLQGAVDNGKVAYHQDKAQACLDAFEGRGCDLFTTRAPDECLEAIVGTVPEDGACTLDFECEGRLFCKADGMCPGACTPLQAAGTACSNSDECVDGLLCDDNLGVCTTPAGVGDICDEGAPNCAMGLACWGDPQVDEPRRCISNETLFSKESGAACNLSGELCTVDSYCAFEIDMDVRPPALVGTCVAEVASGSACKTALPDQCPQNEYCKTPETGPQEMPIFDGTCTSLPEAGAACLSGDAWAPRCVTGTACVNEKCETLERLGGSCTGGNACYSEACVDGVCVAPTACTN